MLRLLGRGAAGLGLAAGTCFVHSKIRESSEEDISDSFGAGLPLTALGNAVNYTGTMYQEFTGKPLSKFSLDKFKVDEVFRKEVDTYCGDMSAEERQRIVGEYRRLAELFSGAENDISNSAFSPLGRLVRVGAIDKYMDNRKAILDYCTQPERSFLLSSIMRTSVQTQESLQKSVGDVEESKAADVEVEELRRRSLPVDAENGLLVVTGMHRTGSTLLQRLLALDPQCRSPMTWEMMQSVPPVQSRAQLTADPRLERARGDLSMVEKLFCPNIWEKLSQVHHFHVDEVEEDFMVLMQLLVPFSTSFWHQNDELIDAVLSARAYHRYKCRFIHIWFQMAASNGFRPASHWITKNPDHAQYLDVLLEEFPRANVVVTHRDPKNVIGSWSKILPISHHYMIHNKYKGSDIPFSLTHAGLGKVCMQHMLTSVTRMMAARDRIAAADPKMAEERFFDVCFSELVKDPEGVIERIYKKFGYDFSDEFRDRIRKYKAEQPRHKRGKVRYSLEDVKLTKAEVDDKFSAYRERYGKFF